MDKLRASILVLPLLIGLLAGPSSADTILPPLIDVDMILTAEGSPYLAQGDVSIVAGVSVTALPGVEIHFAEYANLFVYGIFDVEGSEEAPVHLVPETGAECWGALVYFNASGASQLRHAVIEHAWLAGGEDWGPAALSVMRTPLTVEHCVFQNNAACIKSYESDIRISDCEFPPGNSQELINLQLGEVIVERCRLFEGANHGDAIDLDGNTEAVVRDCYFEGGDDDGIDMGRTDADGATAFIINNVFVRLGDRAVTVGETSTGYLTGNVFIDCPVGVEVKENSVASIDHCSFYGNDVGVRCWEPSEDAGGGVATIENSIIAGSLINILVLDELSSAQARYCCTDDQLLPGEGNLFADPRYVDPENADLTLNADSPCINAGDPLVPPDPDGSRSDMGALPFDQLAQLLVINEINYHSADDFDPGDWIEIFNPEIDAANIGGMKFTGESGTFTLPQGTVVPGQGYLVLCSDLSAFQNLFPEVEHTLGDLGFELDDGGEVLGFASAADSILDFVHYDDAPPWPVEAGGGGSSLELTNPWADNALPESWIASTDHGSPGSINPSSVTVADSPAAPCLLSAFPNPFNPRTTLHFTLSRLERVELSVFDLGGRLVERIATGEWPAGTHEIRWNAAHRPSGLYLCRLAAGKDVSTLKLLLLQ